MRKNNPCHNCELKENCKETYPYEARSSRNHQPPFERKKEGKCLKLNKNGKRT